MDRHSSRRQFLAGGCAALGATVAGCTDSLEGSGDGMGEPDGNGPEGVAAVVAVGPGGDVGFEPSEVRIESGRVVRWEWKSDGHTITPESIPEGASWSGVQERREAGSVYEFRFEVVGPYQYLCDAHPAETTGVVHVR